MKKEILYEFVGVKESRYFNILDFDIHKAKIVEHEIIYENNDVIIYDDYGNGKSFSQFTKNKLDEKLISERSLFNKDVDKLILNALAYINMKADNMAIEVNDNINDIKEELKAEEEIMKKLESLSDLSLDLDGNFKNTIKSTMRHHGE